MRTKPNESAIENETRRKLRELGWVDDIRSDNNNIWSQQPATEEQRKKMKGKRADLILYQSGTNGTLLDNPLIVIEVKRPDENIAEALEQGIGYAKIIGAPLVIATTDEITKCFHVNFEKTLIRDGEEVRELFNEKEALKFIEQPRLTTKEDKVILDRQGLIKIFGEANGLLREDGLRKDERFSEFANILFLKIISEMEEMKEKPIVEKNHLWSSWAEEKGDNLKSRIDGALGAFRQRYQEEELFSVSKIKSVKVIEEIVAKINPLSLVEVDSDIKGDAFEYFLRAYSGQKNNDLGEYFTPRHVISNLVNILQPRVGDKIYDPFCGTGGMLIECFKYVSKQANPDEKEKLKKCFYGNEITTIARTAKMNMILFGDGHNNIQQVNSFQYPVDNKYDLVITNIPFGLEEKDYGNKYKISCEYSDCLAIQHCLRACKFGGKVAMIMPENFFTNKKYKKYQTTRKEIVDNYSIQAIISLPQKIFEPYTGAKSSVIIIEKKKRTKDYFYYYQVKKDEFTLDKQRKRIEGANDWNILVSSWERKLIKEENPSPLFTKIYYKDIENNKYNLLTRPVFLSLPKNQEKKKYISLSEITDTWRGCVEPKAEEFANNGFAKVYQSSHATNDNFSLGNRYITEEKYQQLKKYELQVNDIIMSFSGTYLGKVALFPETAEKGIAWSMGVAVIRIKQEWKEKILPEYLLFICRTPQIEKFLLGQTFGTTIQSLQLDILRKFPVPIPSLEEQQKAVKELNKIRENIRNAQKTIDDLNCSLSLSLSCETKKISDICLVNPPKSEIKNKKDVEFSFLPMEDCEEYSLWVYPQQVKEIEEVRKGYTYFSENDLLIAKITPCFENGKMSIAKNLKNGIGFGSTEFIVLRAKKRVLIEWVYYCLRNSDFIEKGKNHMTGTTGRQRLKQEFVENYLIPLPPLEIQERFTRELKEEQEIIGYQKQSIKLLKEKEKKILARLWEND